MFHKDTQAAPPNINTIGVCFGSTIIDKADLPKINNEIVNLQYTGENLPLTYIDDFYENMGKVYYKIGENGSWSDEIPVFSEMGNYDIYYYVLGNNNYNDLGNQYNPIKITVKINADLPKIEDNVLNLEYKGDDVTLTYIDDFYKNMGKVYHRIGENGSWSDEIPVFSEIGNYNLYYYVVGNDNYNDLGNIENPVQINVNVEVPKDNWGTRVNNNGIINYVSANGTTSAEITENGVIWLKEESDGTSAWYGVDNSQGTFAKGSRFWVKWLSAENDPEEYQEYFEKLDETHKKQAEENKLWIFLTGVTGPDGKDYTDLGIDIKIPYYIQLGDDWDEEDVNALFISGTEDEPVNVQFGTVESFNSQFDNINFPETTGSYARLLLRHFSPYAVYDKVDNNSQNDDSQSEEKNKNKDDSQNEEYENKSNSYDNQSSESRYSSSNIEKSTKIKTGIQNSRISMFILMFFISLTTLALCLIKSSRRIIMRCIQVKHQIKPILLQSSAKSDTCKLFSTPKIRFQNSQKILNSNKPKTIIVKYDVKNSKNTQEISQLFSFNPTKLTRIFLISFESFLWLATFNNSIFFRKKSASKFIGFST